MVPEELSESWVAAVLVVLLSNTRTAEDAVLNDAPELASLHSHVTSGTLWRN